jgi:hypothetical protein
MTWSVDNHGLSGREEQHRCIRVQKAFELSEALNAQYDFHGPASFAMGPPDGHASRHPRLGHVQREDQLFDVLFMVVQWCRDCSDSRCTAQLDVLVDGFPFPEDAEDEDGREDNDHHNGEHDCAGFGLDVNPGAAVCEVAHF